MEKELNVKQLILKQLDGKKARVDSDGLYIQGSIEGNCLLNFSEQWGLIIKVPLQWNDIKVAKILTDTVQKVKAETNAIKGYDSLAVIDKALTEVINNTWVVAATIYYRSIKNINLNTNDKEEITSLNIKFETSTVNIRIVK